MFCVYVSVYIVFSPFNAHFPPKMMYRNLPIKRPWALEIHGPKNGGGRLHGEAICTYNAYAHGP